MTLGLRRGPGRRAIHASIHVGVLPSARSRAADGTAADPCCSGNVQGVSTTLPVFWCCRSRRWAVAASNADLARARLGIGRFPHLQGLGAGMPGDPDRSHRHVLRGRHGTRAQARSARRRSHLSSQTQPVKGPATSPALSGHAAPGRGRQGTLHSPSAMVPIAVASSGQRGGPAAFRYTAGKHKSGPGSRDGTMSANEGCGLRGARRSVWCWTSPTAPGGTVGGVVRSAVAGRRGSVTCCEHISPALAPGCGSKTRTSRSAPTNGINHGGRRRRLGTRPARHALDHCHKARRASGSAGTGASPRDDSSAVSTMPPTIQPRTFRSDGARSPVGVGADCSKPGGFLQRADAQGRPPSRCRVRRHGRDRIGARRARRRLVGAPTPRWITPARDSARIG